MNSINLPHKSPRSPRDVIHRVFPGISQNEVDELILLGETRHYPSESILCQEGTLDTKFYILLDGYVNITKAINNSDERKLKMLKAGDFFGEMAIIHKAARAATVTAASPVTVLEIEKEVFEHIFEHSRAFAIAMVREISLRLRENDEMAVEDIRIRAGELAEAYQKLATQELIRREFISNVAHELRTPLMAASGYLQLVQKGNFSPEKLPLALDTIGRNIQSITSLVNDMLFLQEIDMILPKFQPVDMNTITKAVMDKYLDKAKANSIDILFETDPNLPKVSGDAKSLEHAIMALVDNAIKFSPDGGQIEINLHKEENYVIISVKDHGIGIEPENLPRLFDRFYRSETNGEIVFRGIGLGLAITNQVINQHNGKLTIASEPEKGSTFTVRLKAMKVVF
jgi:signal transduction histidine kinase